LKEENLKNFKNSNEILLKALNYEGLILNEELLKYVVALFSLLSQERIFKSNDLSNFLIEVIKNLSLNLIQRDIKLFNLLIEEIISFLISKIIINNFK
jgi:CII-binding regulator of phage lambda lysogenization HflD